MASAWSGVVVVGLAAVMTACSASASEPSGSASSSAALSGAYMPKTSGAAPANARLLGIVLSGDRYRLRRAPCDDSSCEEIGKFQRDEARGRLELTSESGRTTSMALEVVSTRSPESSTRPAAIGVAATQLIEAPATLLVADQVLLDGESYEDESGLCEGQTIFNGTATHTTRTYLGNERDRKNVGDMACSKARDEADKACRKSPWICTATPSGTTSLPPDCSGTLEITCRCSASTKCNYVW